jgi:hypothetical protein
LFCRLSFANRMGSQTPHSSSFTCQPFQADFKSCKCLKKVRNSRHSVLYHPDDKRRT